MKTCTNVLLLTAFAYCSVVEGFSVSNAVTAKSASYRQSPLFQAPDGASNKPKLRFSLHLERRRLGRTPIKFQLHLLSMMGKIRRTAVLVVAAAMIWFSAGVVWNEPAQASSPSSTAIALQSRNLMSPSLDHIVNRYIQDHMFDDDVYDPVESLYREAMADKVKGTYPKALRETTSSVLDQEGFKAEKTSSSSGIGDALIGAVGFLQRKGLSETTAMLLLAGAFVAGIPSFLIIAAMMVGNQSKRQIRSVMRKRYGDTYTVDATIKVEEDIDLPDDDDDSGDNDEDDDSDKDDEDDK